MVFVANMFVLFLLFGAVFCAPTDEFGQFSNDGINESTINQDEYTRNIVPGISNYKPKFSHRMEEELKLPFLLRFDEDSEYVENFNNFIKKGVTSQGLTFNIYNDDMREAAITLFRIFQALNDQDYDVLKTWCEENINIEMYMYALRLASLYGTRLQHLMPPFITTPHHFINAETIIKASMIMNSIRSDENIDPQIAKENQFEYVYESIESYVVINTNYSGWQLPYNGVEEAVNYFREDIALNSYYYGIHLKHPFWMDNEELDMNNAKHAEHYYYAHLQLMARYLLEKEHLKQGDYSDPNTEESDYVPNLIHKNGLPFPTRSCVRKNWDDEQALLKKIDIALREIMDRGLLIMQNGTTVSMTEDNHIDVLARLIKANLDSVKTAKIVRSVFGYGGTKVPIDEYNPAPTLLHFPETSLRDPIYWFLIQYMLNYFNTYKEKMKPYNISEYESTDINIVEGNFSKIMTYFDYYTFPVNYALTYKTRNVSDWPGFISARQRRLKHTEFTFNFTVESDCYTEVVVRLYLGPPCGGSNCWDQYTRFFELDTFIYELNEGINFVTWSPDTSLSLSSDNHFNIVALRKTSDKSYSMFKFPENLIVPKGLEQGLNLTLFVMITNADDETKRFPSNYYNSIVTEMDTKPIGFPFHRKATGADESATNYKFFNITIYHKKLPVDRTGYFSPHLY